MPGKIDEISQAIGAQAAGLEALNRTFTQHCQDDDDRHKENIATLRKVDQRLADLNLKLSPLIDQVAKMQPIIDASNASRLKMTGAVSLAATLIAAFGMALVEVMKYAVAHIR